MTGDIWLRESGLQQLYPSSALRIADHHLHASGMIEHIENGKNRLYTHDWYCVSQAVNCFAEDGLLKKSMIDAQSSIFVMDVGRSSIHFGNVLSLNDQVLATTQRVFCRKASGKSAPFTVEEKNRFLECRPPLNVFDKYTMPQLKRFDTTTLPAVVKATDPILTVRVGPQHVNFGNHADHAFLAETAFHGLSLVNREHEGGLNLAINYVSEAFLGDTLECFSYEHKIYVTRTLDSGERELVVVSIAAE